MNNTTTVTSTHPRKPFLRLWHGVSLLSAALLFVVALGLRPSAPRPQWSNMIDLPIVALPVLSLLAGYGLSLPFVVGWVNRQHWRRFLRFGWAKMIAAVLIAGFTPIAIWGGLPFALGFGLVLFGYSALATGNFPFLFATVGIALGAPVLAYGVCAALIWGLPKRHRIGGFMLFYAAQLALVAALGLIYSGLF